MGTQFKDVADMFKRLPKVAERARAFVGKATRVPATYDKNRLPPRIGRVFVAPAANAGEWDSMLTEVPCSYLMATDDGRLHVALVATRDVPDDAVPYEPQLRFVEVIEGASAEPVLRTFTLDARQLREAIAASAEYVSFSVPAKKDEAVIVAGLAAEYGYVQVSWAAVMPMTGVPAGAAPKLAVSEEATHEASPEQAQEQD